MTVFQEDGLCIITYWDILTQSIAHLNYLYASKKVISNL